MPEGRETRAEKIARLAYEYKHLRRTADEAIELADEKASQLLPLLPSNGEKVEGLEYQDWIITATKVQRQSAYVNENGLRKKIPVRVWNAISRRVLDQTKLEVAIKDELIDPATIKEFTSYTDQKPFPAITIKERTR